MLKHISGISIIGAINSESSRNTKNLGRIRPVRTPEGQPKFCAGRKGLLLDVVIDNNHCALKCYSEPAKRTAEVCEYVCNIGSDRLPRPTFYPQELAVPVQGGVEWADVSLYPWVEGRTLDFEIRRHAHNGNAEMLGRLAAEFASLALDILNSPWRHGDLKPENIIVGPDGRMVLVDLDALWAESLPVGEEVGTPEFVHPLRGAAYDSHIDDYPIALIATNLCALALHPDLPLQPLASNGLLFTPTEAIEGGEVFGRVAHLLASEVPTVEPLCAALADPHSHCIANLKDMLTPLCTAHI